MKLLIQESVDPYFNIATEEHLLKSSDEDVTMLYRNSPSVIVGKHQNTMAEINHAFISKNRIPVIRRLSGGGAVYHDLGNINFCFIQNSSEGKQVDFKRFTRPIIKFLIHNGLQAALGEKNEIRVGPFKISGNAEHVYKSRVLHHGTLLFRTNLNNLNLAIKSNEKNYIDRAIRSNRSVTENISTLMGSNLSTENFLKKLSEFLSAELNAFVTDRLQKDDMVEIKKLINEKYSKWDWNYGYNASYTIESKIRDFQISLKVVGGIIAAVDVIGGSQTESLKNIFSSGLLGLKHDYITLEQSLQEKSELLVKSSIKAQELLDILF